MVAGEEERKRERKEIEVDSGQGICGLGSLALFYVKLVYFFFFFWSKMHYSMHSFLALWAREAG